VKVGAPIESVAEVAATEETAADAGAPGVVGATVNVNVPAPVDVFPSGSSVVAVMVKVVEVSATVGVPDITPEVGSSDNPAGSAPAIE
jgi:hypothetical protein